jgi:hypothetical protein
VCKTITVTNTALLAIKCVVLHAEWLSLAGCIMHAWYFKAE